MLYAALLRHNLNVQKTPYGKFFGGEQDEFGMCPFLINSKTLLNFKKA